MSKECKECEYYEGFDYYDCAPECAYDGGIKNCPFNDEIKPHELKPCPFCGGKAVYESKVEVIPIRDENGAYIGADTYYHEKAGCPSCDIWFFINEDGEEESTIKNWNRRTNDE